MANFDTRSAIALILVCSMVGMAFVLAFHPAPDSDVFKVIIGGLVTVGFSSIISFYFGSSTGSKSKDDTLNKIAASNITGTNGVDKGTTDSTGASQ